MKYQFNMAAAAIFFRQSLISQTYILQEHSQPLPKDDQMIKKDTGRKFKMAAAAILKSVKRQ